MANNANGLEEKLNDLFVNKLPKLPDGGKKFLVDWAPILSIIIGVLSLLSAYTLWNWAHAADAVINYANQICNTYAGAGCATPAASRYSLWLWLGVIFLAAEGLLYLFAFPGLKAKKKQGWKYLYYGAIVNVIYAFVSLFASYDVTNHFLGALIGSAIGFYLLFQIRSAYTDGSKRPAKASSASKS